VTHSHPRLLRTAFLLLFIAVLALAIPSRSVATIKYEVSLAGRAQHLFAVTMTIPDVHGEVQVQMPAWNALYQVRDFASRIQRVEASANFQSLPVEKLDKQTWKIRGEGEVTVKYSIYWDSPGPFASQLNEEHAFINPAMVFMYVPDRRRERIELSLRNLASDWHSATTLNPMFAERDPIAPSYFDENYDAFADAPIELAAFKLFRITGIDTPINVAIHGDNWKQSEVEDTLRKLCKYEIELMGGAPFKRYLFIYHSGKAAGGAGGGMEHANGTAINISGSAQIAGVSAHEFFHLWNVKRIRPASLEPIDYTREQYSRALWFAEGVTSTYGRYAQVRSGLWTKQDFYADLAAQINELESRPANKWQSAEQSSLDTWLDKYDYYSGPDFSISYYTKGQVLGDVLDILIRDCTDNAKSLDDVLRKMNEDFAAQGKPYRDSLDIRLTVEAIAGESFEEFFQKYVASAEAIPYAEILAKAGLLLQRQEVVRAQLGFSLERDSNGRWVVRVVDPGSTAERAGLKAGDEIKLWNGENVPRRAELWLRNKKPGDELALHILRGEQQSEISFALGGSSASVFVLSEDPQSSAKARAIREGILHGKTDAPYAPAKAASAKPEIIVPTSAAARNAADSASQAVFATASGEK
jgi:predicted metalloprotease with PDZ domain